MQYTRVKWDSQGTKKISPTQRMSQLTKSPGKWGFDKNSENVPLIKSFQINQDKMRRRTSNKQRNCTDIFNIIFKDISNESKQQVKSKQLIINQKRSLSSFYVLHNMLFQVPLIQKLSQSTIAARQYQLSVYHLKLLKAIQMIATPDLKINRNLFSSLKS